MPITPPQPTAPGYFGSIWQGVRTTWAGMRTTWRHMRQTKRRRVESIVQPTYFTQKDGPVTIQYPQEQLPLPDVGRYRLHMETPDCIACDQCARVCPVDCITIEKVKAVEDLGLTSDGTKKRFWLPTFDIDMAKCCYCGLCTVVCPTECLVMTNTYDYSEYDRENFIYHFGNLSPEETKVKEAELEAHEEAIRQAKEAAKQQALEAKKAEEKDTPTEPEPEKKALPKKLPPLPFKKPPTTAQKPEDKPNAPKLPPIKKPPLKKPPISFKPKPKTDVKPDNKPNKPNDDG